MIQDTIRYDTLYLRAPKSWRIATLICRTEPNIKRVTKKLKTKTEMLRRNVRVIKSMVSVRRPEGSRWWERYVKEVGVELGIKERGSYGWWEWWVDTVRNRQVSDRGTGMRLTESTRKLIPETRWGVPKGVISYTQRGRCWWSSEGNKRWRASAARRLIRDEVMQIWRLDGRKDFVSEWEEFVFDAFSYFESVQR